MLWLWRTQREMKHVELSDFIRLISDSDTFGNFQNI